MGKRVASASTLFHPPTILALLLGPRGAEEEMVEEVEEKGEKGGQGVVRGWRAGGKRELGGTVEGDMAKGEGLSHAYPLDSSL